jgi:hypothetical protein
MQLQRHKPNQYKFEELMMKKLSFKAATKSATLAATLATASLLIALTTTAALAKLPAPSDEAKAKAAEAAAKTAWNGKVDGFLLCKSQDKAAAHYYKTAKSTKPAAAMPPCADPGAFVYPLPVAAAPATPVVTAAAAAPAAAVVAAAAVPAKPAVPAVPAKKP